MSEKTGGGARAGTGRSPRPAIERGADARTSPTRGAPAWDDLASFLAVARQGGLSGAARESGSSAPTLGRRMRALERALGTELFVRRTHGYDLTESGARLRERLEAAEGIIARATAAHAADTLPRVRIAAGTWTTLKLVRALPALAGDPPDLRVRLLQGEDVLSIPRREVSVGFRSARPDEPGLAGRRLRRVEFVPYAAPGAPERWIVSMADTASARWVRERAGDAIACEVSAPRLLLDLALAGAGRALLPSFVGDEHPALERVGAVVQPLTHEQWLVSHAEDRALPEVRRALDRIGTLMGASANDEKKRTSRP